MDDSDLMAGLLGEDEDEAQLLYDSEEDIAAPSEQVPVAAANLDYHPSGKCDCADSASAATLTRNCRKFCFQQDTRPVCGPAPSRDLCLSKLVIPIIICLWHNEQSGWLFAIASTKYKYERRRVCILHATLQL